MSASRESLLLFEQLMERHMDIVFHVARAWSGDSQEAEDLTQIAFLKAFKAFHRFQIGTNFKAWILGILRNSFIDAKRKQKRRPGTVSLQALSPLQEPEASAVPIEAVNLESREVFYDLFGDEVARLLRQIPDDFRMAVLLSDVEGLSYQEIAEVLDCPIGTVRSRIHRGRALLQKRLRDYARKAGYLREAAS